MLVGYYLNKRMNTILYLLYEQINKNKLVGILSFVYILCHADRIQNAVIWWEPLFQTQAFFFRIFLGFTVLFIIFHIVLSEILVKANISLIENIYVVSLH